MCYSRHSRNDESGPAGVDVGPLFKQIPCGLSGTKYLGEVVIGAPGKGGQVIRQYILITGVDPRNIELTGPVVKMSKV